LRCRDDPAAAQVNGESPMLFGKYWLIGKQCIDVTCSEHALYARNYLLGILGTQNELRLDKTLFRPLSKRQVARFERLGADSRVLSFLRGSNADARNYAIEHLNWIRTRANRFYVWKMNAKTWRVLRSNRAYWVAQSKYDKSEVLLLCEINSGRTSSVSSKTLLEGKSYRSFLKSLEVVDSRA